MGGLSAEDARDLWQAKTSGSGTYISDGNYVFAVKRLLVNKGYKGRFLIGEFLVLDSERVNPDAAPNAVGTECSVAFQLDGAGRKGSAQKGNAKDLMCALLGHDARSEDSELGRKFVEAVIRYAGSPDSPESTAARGMLVVCRTQRRKTQEGENAGSENVYPRFHHVSDAQGNSAEAIAKRSKIMAECSSAKAAELIAQL